MKKSVSTLLTVLFSGSLLFSSLAYAQESQPEAASTPPTTVEQPAAAKGKKALINEQVSINQATAEALSEVMLGIGLKKRRAL